MLIWLKTRGREQKDFNHFSFITLDELEKTVSSIGGQGDLQNS